MHRERQRGNALFIAVLVIMLILSLTGAFLSVALARSGAQQQGVHLEQALKLCDAAVGIKIAQLNGSPSDDSDLDVTMGDGSHYTVTVTPIVDGERYELSTHGYVGDEHKGLHVVVNTDLEPLEGNLPGAIIANNPISTLGSITIDGRDHTPAGGLSGSPGVFGVKTSGGLSIAGSSGVGGKGQAPAGSAGGEGTRFDSSAVWGDGTDMDGDGTVEPEELPFPTSPDDVVGLPDGTLKDMAIAAGWYFTNTADFNDAMDEYADDNGNKAPSGVVIYLDYALEHPLLLPTNLNDEPSILVMHKNDGSGKFKNLHGKFKGLMIGDKFEHFNGDFFLTGGVVSFAPSSYNSTFGNGSAEILYSSEVLGNLPKNPTAGQPFDVVSWREENVADPYANP